MVQAGIDRARGVTRSPTVWFGARPSRISGARSSGGSHARLVERMEAAPVSMRAVTATSPAAGHGAEYSTSSASVERFNHDGAGHVTALFGRAYSVLYPCLRRVGQGTVRSCPRTIFPLLAQGFRRLCDRRCAAGAIASSGSRKGEAPVRVPACDARARVSPHAGSLRYELEGPPGRPFSTAPLCSGRRRVGDYGRPAGGAHLGRRRSAEQHGDDRENCEHYKKTFPAA